MTGPVGGPFSSSGFTTKIGNRSTQPLSWTATSVPSFVQLSPSSGTLAGHTRVPFQVDLDTAAAGSMVAGDYAGVIRLHNNTTAEADIVVTCRLTIAAPPTSSQLTPSTDFFSQGLASGPFQPDSQTYTLTNTGSGSLSWQAATADAWVTASPASGQLAPGASANVSVAIADPATASLSTGTHRSFVEWRDAASTAVIHTRDVSLDIQVPTQSSTLLPSTNFSSQGPASGPFQPDSQSYTLANTGSATLSWQATATDAWVSLAPSSGQLAPGASAIVNVSITDPATGSLSNGVHQSTVEWSNAATNAVLHSRTVDLNIQAGSSSSGWTVFNPSADTRIIYVSSSTGNDAYNGLSSSTPKRTIAAGRSLLRNGYPDWLLLKTGDSWDQGLGPWGLSGRSGSERMLISSYGTSPVRPLLRTGTDNGFSAFDNAVNNHIAIVGLHFWANLFNGGNGAPRGLQAYGQTRNLLIEDCYFQAFDTNIVVQGTPEGVGRHQNVTIRRNVIVDAYTTGSGNTSGIFASSIDGALIEENVLDHNGWRDDVAGSYPNWFRRNVYIQNGNTGIVFRGNIVASTDGIQLRSGGVMEDNLFLRNSIAMELGGGTNPEPQGVSGTVRRNVVLDGRDLQAGNPRGWGLWLMNLTSATVDSNVIAHNVNGHGPFPVTFGTANGWGGNYRGVENTVFSNNVVYAWNGFSRFTGNASQTVNIQFLNNKVQNEITMDPLLVHDQSSSTSGVFSSNNQFHNLQSSNYWMQLAGGSVSFTQWKTLVHDTTSVAQQVTFPDPTRKIETYQLTLGGAPTLEAFLAQARLQSKANWRLQYTAGAVNNYVRAGFGL